jgi:DNA-directed RNA polymerase specialized sigma24 family protein
MHSADKCLALQLLLTQRGAALALYAAQWSDTPDDAVQEAFIRLAGVDPWPVEPIAWLYIAVKNFALTQGRAGRRREHHERLAAQMRQVQHEPRDELNEARREIILAKIWGSLTFEQLATVFNMSRSQVHREYIAALTELRSLMEETCPTTKKN